MAAEKRTRSRTHTHIRRGTHNPMYKMGDLFYLFNVKRAQKRVRK